MKPVVFAFFISLIITFDGASAARILGIFPFPGKSHFIMFERLMKGLADKGHEVDMLSPFPQKESLPRFKDLSVEGVFPNITNNVTMDDLNALSFHALVKSIFEEGGTDLCEAVFNSSAGQQLMKTKVKYDLIITEIFGTDCFLGYAHLFQVPVIAMVTSFPYPWVSERFGLPDNPSYIMNYFFPYVGQFSLLQRVKNVFMSIYAKLGYHYYSTLACNVVARKYFGPDLPDLATLANNMSLLLVNSHHSWYQARPLPPNVKEVAGLHIKLPKSTEGELGEFLNKSSNGVIYFSMGSMVRTDSLDLKRLSAFVNAFRKLDKYKVLWKANETLIRNKINDVPNNIKFANWLPQMDILCHPNTKVFISHGGLMGTQEAISCGVPIIGIPLFADQFLNMEISSSRRLGIIVNYEDISEEKIFTALNETLENPSYQLNARKASMLFRDRLIPPLNEAIYWVEYVIRHHGAPNLRPLSVDLPWYKYFLVDVGCIIIALVLFVLSIIYLVMTIVLKFNCIFKSQKKKKEKRKDFIA